MVTGKSDLNKARVVGERALDSSDLDLRPPPLRGGLVFRQRLVEAFRSTDRDVIILTAPVGYGKTTALAQWASVEEPPVAWLRLQRNQTDAKEFIRRLAASLSRSGILNARDMGSLRFLRDSDVTTLGVTRLVDLLRSRVPSITLIIDDAERLRSRAANQVVAEMLSQLEGTARIALASRSDLGVNLSLTRAQGRLLELTASDLEMTEEETRELISGYGMGPDSAPRIREVTEGWAAAISLLAMAIERWDLDVAEVEMAGNSRLLADFVTGEILPRLTSRRREFLLRVSPLARLNASLGDAVTGSDDSWDMLRGIESSTHLVFPLEETHSWYRMNRVVREALLAQLEGSEPEAVIAAHARAASWYEENGMPESALDHAVKADDKDTVARVLSEQIQTAFASGNLGQVLNRMAWLEANDSLDRHPELAAAGALLYVLEGKVLDVDRWLEAAMKPHPEVPSSPVVWLVRALTMRSGMERMKTDVAALRVALTPGSAWIPAALLTHGLALLWNGDSDEAEPLFAEAAALGEKNGSWPTATLAIAERAMIAIGRHDWDLASDLANQSIRLIEEHGLDGSVTSGLGFVAAARCARHRNDIAKAKVFLTRAASVRPRLSASLPGLAVQTLVEMARSHVELSDVVGGRVVIRDASDVLVQRPDLGLLGNELRSVKDSLSARGPGTVGPSALTKAELRLLPLLATHLSFPEIGEQLFISRHTVKTQAMSIYRKLSTSSRSDAVAKAFEVGLLTQ